MNKVYFCSLFDKDNQHCEKCVCGLSADFSKQAIYQGCEMHYIDCKCAKRGYEFCDCIPLTKFEWIMKRKILGIE